MPLKELLVSSCEQLEAKLPTVRKKTLEHFVRISTYIVGLQLRDATTKDVCSANDSYLNSVYTEQNSLPSSPETAEREEILENLNDALHRQYTAQSLPELPGESSPPMSQLSQKPNQYELASIESIYLDNIVCSEQSCSDNNHGIECGKHPNAHMRYNSFVRDESLYSIPRCELENSTATIERDLKQSLFTQQRSQNPHIAHDYPIASSGFDNSYNPNCHSALGNVNVSYPDFRQFDRCNSEVLSSDMHRQYTNDNIIDNTSIKAMYSKIQAPLGTASRFDSSQVIGSNRSDGAAIRNKVQVVQPSNERFEAFSRDELKTILSRDKPNAKVLPFIVTRKPKSMVNSRDFQPDSKSASAVDISTYYPQYRDSELGYDPSRLFLQCNKVSDSSHDGESNFNKHVASNSGQNTIKIDTRYIYQPALHEYHTSSKQLNTPHPYATAVMNTKFNKNNSMMMHDIQRGFHEKYIKCNNLPIEAEQEPWRPYMRDPSDVSLGNNDELQFKSKCRLEPLSMSDRDIRYINENTSYNHLAFNNGNYSIHQNVNIGFAKPHPRQDHSSDDEWNQRTLLHPLVPSKKRRLGYEKVPGSKGGQTRLTFL